MRKLITPSRKLVTPAEAWPPDMRVDHPRPRYGPWWRLSKGLLKGCCCGGCPGVNCPVDEGNECDNCEGTPTHVDITFADVSLCSCARMGDTGRWADLSGFSVNKTVMAEQVGVSCTWIYCEPSVAVDVYDNDSCSGAPVDVNYSVHATYGIVKGDAVVSTRIRLLVRCESPPCFTGDIPVFNGRFEDTCCFRAATINNTMPACGDGSPTSTGLNNGCIGESGIAESGATGGTATISPCDEPEGI